jgi:hypothetical protein
MHAHGVSVRLKYAADENVRIQLIMHCYCDLLSSAHTHTHSHTRENLQNLRTGKSTLDAWRHLQDVRKQAVRLNLHVDDCQSSSLTLSFNFIPRYLIEEMIV